MPSLYHNYQEGSLFSCTLDENITNFIVYLWEIWTIFFSEGPYMNLKDYFGSIRSYIPFYFIMSKYFD